MAQPIYKLWLAKPTALWLELSHEEQQQLFAQENEAFEKAGGKRPILCNSSWASEQWPLFGVEEFPDIAAVQQFAQALNDLKWSRYFESTIVLGTPWEPA